MSERRTADNDAPLPRRAMGSLSSRMGASWSRKGADYRDRQESRRASHGTASLQETVTPPSVEAMRRAIEANACPFCGAGPFKNLGLHTHIAHGIGAAELRTLADVERVCSEELSNESRDRLLRRPDRDEITSRAGRASVAKQSAAGHPLGENVWQRMREIAEHRDPELIRRATSGDELLETIAADFGITPHAARVILARHGLTPNITVANQGRRQRLEDYRPAVADVRRRKAAEVTAARLARFRELGEDWDALLVMAAEAGITVKSARAFLKANGIVIDGRTVSPNRGRWQVTRRVIPSGMNQETDDA